MKHSTAELRRERGPVDDPMERERLMDELTGTEVVSPGVRRKGAYWRIVPKRSASDQFRRHFQTREDAEETLAAMRRRRSTYKVVAYNADGKQLP